jgi:phytol kinase
VPSKHSDLVLVAVSALAISAFVLLAFAIARRGFAPPSLIRKLLHAAVGAWTLAITPSFHQLGWALVLPGLFLVVNASPHARPLFQAIAETPERAKGLWTFPAGVILVYLLFWEAGARPAILAGLAALAFADPLAAMVGTRFGQRRFGAWGHGRTLEGSLAFFLLAALGAGLVASRAEPGAGTLAWRAGVGCGVAGAAIEALAPSGWDNLAIPVAVAAAYRFLV